MGTEVLAPQYMTRFQCIADRCEDTCCKGWVVNVDRDSYERIQKSMVDAGEGETLEERIVLVEGETASHHNFAHLQHSDDASCTFLDENLCSLQNKYGHTMLPITCRNFPRRLVKADAELEFSGDVGCPEVARLLLLSEDAMDLTGMPLDAAGFAIVKDEFTKDDPHPYRRHVNDVRTLMIYLFNQSQYSLEQRLFFAAFFANRTLPFFHDNTSEDVSHLLQEQIDAIANGETLEQLAARIDEIEIPLAMMRTLAGEIILAGAKNHRTTAFKQLALEVLGHLQEEEEEKIREAIASEALWERYAENKDRIYTRGKDRVERYFSNLALNYWLQQWYTQSPNLLAHLQKQLIPMAISKFLLFSHPDVQEALDGPEETLHQVLDAMVVRVCYATERAIAHSGLLNRIESQLIAMELQSFAGVVYLLKF